MDGRKKYTANCTISNIHNSKDNNKLLFIFNTPIENEEENRLKEILKQTNIGIWEWHKQTNQITRPENMAYFTIEKIFSLQNNKLDIEQCFSNIHKEDLDLVKKKFEECRVYGKNFKIEYRILWPDDSVHWVKYFGRYCKI